MKKSEYYYEIFKRKWKAFLWLLFKNIPDRLYIKIKYFLKFKKWIDLDNPQTFNEKLQYLKIKQIDQIYSDLSDKYKVRDYIKEKLWEEILTKLYWHWKDPESIPFDKLPEKFVIKCNHGSGYNIIVHDKTTLNIKETINILKLRMKEDFWIIKRELQYKNIDKMIIIEELLEWKPWILAADYKFYYFSNKPEIILHVNNRFTRNFCKGRYTIDWKLMDFIVMYPLYKNSLKMHKNSFQKPKILNEMLLLWEKLKDTIMSNFFRVDLYEVNWKIYFWEITLYPDSWLWRFRPNHNELDKKYWELINL